MVGFDLGSSIRMSLGLVVRSSAPLIKQKRFLEGVAVENIILALPFLHNWMQEIMCLEKRNHPESSAYVS